MIPKHFDDATGNLLTPGNYRDILAKLQSVSTEGFGELLDIGSNTTWLAQFAEKYHGIEVLEDLVVKSRRYWVRKQRWTKEEAEKKIVLSNSAALPWPDSTFDVVFMRDVLEHVDNAYDFFKEAARVLKPGGFMYVSCPDAQRHVWDEPSHKRPFPVAAQEYLGHINNLELVWGGYESVLSGTQKMARLFGGRTPWLIRIFWCWPWWPRNAVTIQRKKT